MIMNNIFSVTLYTWAVRHCNTKILQGTVVSGNGKGAAGEGKGCQEKKSGRHL